MTVGTVARYSVSDVGDVVSGGRPLLQGLTWPIWAGEEIGRLITGERHSQLGTVLSWSLEAGWLTFLVLFLISLRHRSQEKRRAQARKEHWSNSARELAAIRKQKNQHTEALATLQTLRRVLLLGERLDGSRHLAFPECALVEPRIGSPGSSTVVDREGRVEITDTGITYVSPTRHLSWPFDRLQQVLDEGEHVLFAVDDRIAGGVLLPYPFRSVFLFAVDVQHRRLAWDDQAGRRFNEIETGLVQGLESCRVREAGKLNVPV